MKMKKLFICFIIILFATMASAAPDLISDPQTGVEEHLFECISVPYSVVTPAEIDGSFKWNFALWPGSHGWFDCTVKARIKYEVTDVVTSVTTEVIEDSDPAQVRIKIPNRNSGANYQVQQ